MLDGKTMNATCISPDGDFVARPQSVGMTDDEAEAFCSGRMRVIPEDRLRLIAFRFSCARASLMNTDVKGRA